MALLRPKLEYCSTVWDPRDGIENNGRYSLEKVQGRAARWVLSRYHPQNSVTNMIEALGWDTLEHSVLLLYRIVNGLVAVDPGDYLCKPARKSTRHVKTHTLRK